MKRILALVLMLCMLAPTVLVVDEAQAYVPIECADGYFSGDCLIAIVIMCMSGGLFNGDTYHP